MVTTLDNTEDPTDRYQTTIFPVAMFTPRNTTFRFSTPSGSGGFSHGLHSLILIPESKTCYFELFKVSKEFYLDGCRTFVPRFSAKNFGLKSSELKLRIEKSGGKMFCNLSL